MHQHQASEAPAPHRRTEFLCFLDSLSFEKRSGMCFHTPFLHVARLCPQLSSVWNFFHESLLKFSHVKRKRTSALTVRAHWTSLRN